MIMLPDFSLVNQRLQHLQALLNVCMDILNDHLPTCGASVKMI